jgi:hypothetical protein
MGSATATRNTRLKDFRTSSRRPDRFPVRERTRPLPVSASWNDGLDTCTITFDLPLRAGTTDTAQYYVYYDGKTYTGELGTKGTVTGLTVIVGLTETGVTAEDNSVRYDGKFRDVLGINGRMVGPYTQEIT